MGTVSRVLNGSSQVRAETRERVLAAIKDLGFSPNSAARQLSGGKTFTIGVVSPFFTFPSFVERLTGIQDVLDETEYDLTLYSVRSPERLAQQFRTIIGQNRVDGLLVLSLPFDEEEVYRLKPGFPIVVVDNEAVERFPHLAVPNTEGGFLATRFLIERGHRDIGFLGDPIVNPFNFTSTLRRFEGFQQALSEAGLACNLDWCQFAAYGQESARETVRAILTRPQRPTALFVATDTLAIAALSEVRDMGLRVPDDVAVIGFDDIQAAQYSALTTVRQHLVESGRWGARGSGPRRGCCAGRGTG